MRLGELTWKSVFETLAFNQAWILTTGTAGQGTSSPAFRKCKYCYNTQILTQIRMFVWRYTVLKRKSVFLKIFSNLKKYFSEYNNMSVYCCRRCLPRNLSSENLLLIKYFHWRPTREENVCVHSRLFVFAHVLINTYEFRLQCTCIYDLLQRYVRGI